MKVTLIACLVFCATVTVYSQTGAKNGEWTTYGGDSGNTRYAPLDQITPENFSKLQIAWRFKTENLGPRPEFNLDQAPRERPLYNRCESAERESMKSEGNQSASAPVSDGFNLKDV